MVAVGAALSIRETGYTAAAVAVGATQTVGIIGALEGSVARIVIDSHESLHTDGGRRGAGSAEVSDPTVLNAGALLVRGVGGSAQIAVAALGGAFFRVRAGISVQLSSHETAPL